MSHKPWYQNGLRFSCTRCGNCCRTHGDYAHIYLADADVEAIAAELGLACGDFRRRYCAEEDGWTTLKSPGPACPFLGEDNRCNVYEVRPMQCRTWPFWDENLERRRWEGPVRATCPGIGTGRRHSAEEIEASARRNEEWYEGGGPAQAPR